jgi:hypothetical protein
MVKICIKVHRHLLLRCRVGLRPPLALGPGQPQQLWTPAATW